MAICRQCGGGIDWMPVPRKRGGLRVETKAHAHGLEDETLYTPAEAEFLQAMDRYKRDNRRPFPTWSEVLQVLVSLGYRKDA